MGHRPNELSGGQRQPASCSRLVSNPSTILLADEPTGNLDSKTGVEDHGSLRTSSEAGNTIVLVARTRRTWLYATARLHS